MGASGGVWLVGLVAVACAGRAKSEGDTSVGGASGSVTTTTTSDSTGNASGGASTSAGGSGGSLEGGAGGSSSVSTVGLGGVTGIAGAGGASTSTSSSGGHAGEVSTDPRPCDSSDGSGCDDGELCLDDRSDACAPTVSSDCEGYCATALPHSNCEGGPAQCAGTVSCPALPEECPTGFVNSIVDECWGPCVPADCCTCASDQDCLVNDALCDVRAGRCTVPAAPEPRCFLPYDPGTCGYSLRAFAFIDGHCVEREWTGCDSNDNRFSTLEECLRRCEGLPQQGECPEGRIVRTTCLMCGGGGGCVVYATVCAQTCETTDDCDASLSCLDGACGVNFCF